MRHIAEIDAALQIGFSIGLSDVTALEFAAVRILREEEASHLEEQSKRDAMERTIPAKPSSF